jgi:4-hydroxybenzoyl-CoA thioesterase
MTIGRRSIQVEWGDCDPAGIVFYPRYFAWFDACTLALFASVDLALHDLFARDPAFGGLPLIDARANFRRASRYGDVLQAESEVVEIEGSRFQIRHRFSRDGELVVEGFEMRAWTSVAPDDKRRLKGQAVPDEVRARLLG